MNNTKCIAVIGARKGSKRLPGKNKVLLADKPLIQYTIEAAINANLFSHIIVSSDDQDILELSKSFSQITVDQRESELANDKASMWDVLENLIAKYDKFFDANTLLCILNPCTPFRNEQHICQSFEHLITSKANSLLSVTEYPIPIKLAINLNDNKLTRNWEGLVRKAEHSTDYYPNGALVWIKVDKFLKYKTVYTDNTTGFVMKWPDSLDIDTYEDYETACMVKKCL